MSLCIGGYYCHSAFEARIAVWVLADMNVGTVMSQTTVSDVHY
jgi:hypothetical protein